MSDNNHSLQPLFLGQFQPCATNTSNSMNLSMGTAITSTNEWQFNQFQDPAIDQFLQQETDRQQETPKEVRTELKKSIQERKFANGEDMPEIEWKEPPPPQPRPPEKPEDIQLRRQKNKIAAKKCREKKRYVREEYRKKIEKQEEIHSNLTEEVQILRKECEKLKNLLRNHHCTLPGASPAMNYLTNLHQQFVQPQTDCNGNELQFNISCCLPPQ